MTISYDLLRWVNIISTVLIAILYYRIWIFFRTKKQLIGMASQAGTMLARMKQEKKRRELVSPETQLKMIQTAAKDQPILNMMLNNLMDSGMDANTIMANITDPNFVRGMEVLSNGLGGLFKGIKKAFTPDEDKKKGVTKPNEGPPLIQM